MTEPTLTENYSVRLLFKVAGETPFEAVESFMDRIKDNGLAGWVYRVTDHRTGEQLIVHPESKEAWTPEEFEQYMAEQARNG